MSVGKDLIVEQVDEDGPKVVAHSYTQYGGKCQRRGCTIRPGDPIVKVDVGKRGGSTKHGQGLGEWWCEPCAEEIVPAAAGASGPDVESLPTSS